MKATKVRLPSLLLMALILMGLLSATAALAQEATAPKATAQKATGTEEKWKADFNRLCGLVQGADALSLEVLGALVRECEDLSKTITATGRADAKVYVFRLAKCREFFKYSIEQKLAEKVRKPSGSGGQTK